MDFFKALIPGGLLTFVVSAVMGKAHSTGGWLAIQHYYFGTHGIYWSWILFVIATGLAWVLIAITPK
ncbi:MAG: hypothetical protein ACKOPG_11090 [Novosphingobium sp.]